MSRAEIILILLPLKVKTMKSNLPASVLPKAKYLSSLYTKKSTLSILDIRNSSDEFFMGSFEAFHKTYRVLLTSVCVVAGAGRSLICAWLGHSLGSSWLQLMG
jgi:hypothetical protein